MTGQLTTAKISTCANGSSNTSRTEKVYAAGIADTQGWQFETYETAQELRMRMKYARKLLFFIKWLFYVQLLRGQNKYRLVWAVITNPLELPINDEARKDAHIASTGVRLY